MVDPKRERWARDSRTHSMDGTHRMSRRTMQAFTRVAIHSSVQDQTGDPGALRIQRYVLVYRFLESRAFHNDHSLNDVHSHSTEYTTIVSGQHMELPPSPDAKAGLHGANLC